MSAISPQEAEVEGLVREVLHHLLVRQSRVEAAGMDRGSVRVVNSGVEESSARGIVVEEPPRGEHARGDAIE